MRKLRWDIVVLLLIMIALFLLRMGIANSVDSMDYESYLLLRNVDHILEEGTPLRDDPLSITGKKRVDSPVFAYMLASLAALSSAFYKILPNLLMVLLLVPVYFLTKKLTNSKTVGIIAGILAGTSPAVFSSYLNIPAPVPLAVLLFMTILALLHNPKKYLFWIVGLTIFLTFLHPLSFVLVLSLLARIVLFRLEHFGADRRMNELFFFTLLLTLWFHVLMYKPALFSEGIRVLWQNLPVKYAALRFQPVTWLKVLYAVGVVTFLFGALGMYHTLFEQRKKHTLSIVGAILAITVLLLLKLVEVKIGFLLLSILLAIMAAYGLQVTWRYIAKTKTPWISFPLTFILLFIFVFTAILPALVQANEAIRAPTMEDVEAFQRITLPKHAVLLTTIREGAAVQYYAQQTTFTDNDFLLLQNGDELVKDIDAVYTAHFSSTILSKARKLGFTHILFSNDAIREYGRERIFVENPHCFTYELLSSNVRLYKIRCEAAE